MRFLWLVAVAALLAGCAGEGQPEGSWSLRGTFTESATQEEMQRLANTFRARFAVDLQLMESFPVQWAGFGFWHAPACREAALHAEAQSFVASVGECRHHPPGEAAGNEPVSTTN